MKKYFELLLIFFRLGITSFGGPVAHIGFFREEFVQRRQWFSEEQYADKVALCQLIPGPASSQIGLLIGFERGGYIGAFLAWLGFTLPSAILLGTLGISLIHFSEIIPQTVFILLKSVALAVVLHAVIGMGKTFCTGLLERSLMLSTTALMLFVSAPWTAPLAIILAANVFLLGSNKEVTTQHIPSKIAWDQSVVWLVLFVVGLIGLPLAANLFPELTVLSDFYRSGALVFGGGHVVLPLLADSFVATDRMQKEVFLAGYAAAQAVPGPLFTFASYIGGSVYGNFAGALIATLAIFAPAVIILFGVYPIWKYIQHKPEVRLAVSGANAAVVGLLLSVFLSMSVTTIDSILAGSVFIAFYTLIAAFKWAPWLLVLASVPLGYIIEVLATG
ncbi:MULTISPECIES: chromate efflux transporter [unclassified Marinobacterium]|uniref:chromate efflux transporter n=1 Tax=unclassified Marinobacterium TaxID=2644139 RepID=UPI00156A5D52|nr:MULTISPECIES: chromate efflux transporter [unclassified Marinobacterium]NRP52324.1 putative chromate transport protein [Marinobacterium sp. xm-v-242]NRP76905.1 putative chromate transport protein [Marinobacterium sp. xm-m-383]